MPDELQRRMRRLADAHSTLPVPEYVGRPIAMKG
jgi:hypothetical protein